MRERKNWEYGAILFCFITALILLALVLMAYGCEKQDCYHCWLTTTTQREGYEVNSRTRTFELCGTRDEILRYDAEQTKDSVYYYMGERYEVKTLCHCMIKTCW